MSKPVSMQEMVSSRTEAAADDAEIMAKVAAFDTPSVGIFNKDGLGMDPALKHYSRDDADGLHPKASLKPGILPSVLHNIGNTPLVRCSRLAEAEGIKCELLAKCEFFNSGGSVKDRIARRMVEEAERDGRLIPGVSTIIEPTSGNTGIGLALAAAVKGYRCIIVMPMKMSQEKVDVLRGLGAEIVRTPTEAAWNSPESHVTQALRLEKEIPHAVVLDQYSNPNNPLAHYDGTAEELIEQCDGKIDYLVAGAGTGGTISGIARKLKEKVPGIQVVGVDPYGSILAQPAELNETDITGYQIEGIGYDFLPKVLDRTSVDIWRKSKDIDAFNMSRKLIRLEGLLCGGSCGSAMSAAVEFCKTLPADKRVVVVLPDSTRNYMSKFLNDAWMEDNNFIESQFDPELQAEWWFNEPVSNMPQNFPITLNCSISCEGAAKIMAKEDFNQMPVIGDDGQIVGIASEANLMTKMIQKKLKGTDPISGAVYKDFKQVDTTETVGNISRMLDKEHFVLVVSKQRCYTSEGEASEKLTIYSIVTRADVWTFMNSRKSGESTPAE